MLNNFFLCIYYIFYTLYSNIKQSNKIILKYKSSTLIITQYVYYKTVYLLLNEKKKSTIGKKLDIFLIYF